MCVGTLCTVIYPGVKCTDEKYQMYMYPVAAFGVLLPFGIVAIYFMELLGNRKALAPKIFRPEAVGDAELQRIPRQLLGLREHRGGKATAGLPGPSAKKRRPSRSITNSLREFTKTIVTCEGEVGVTRAELVAAFERQAKASGKENAVEWLQIIVRRIRGDARHLEFLYAAYRPGYFW